MPELRNLRNRENATKIISETLNDCTVLSSGLLKVIESIRDVTGCEAIGIRLYENGDYPYYVYDGFSEEHVRTESSLCPLEGDDAAAAGSQRPLECICGAVIEERCAPEMCEYCTPGGSFYTNDANQFLEALTEQQRASLVRGCCITQGYQSIALIPVTVAGATVGLLQLNDHRTDMFNGDLIDYLTMIARQIGMAVHSHIAQLRLEEALACLAKSHGLISVCSHCNSILDDDGIWVNVGQFIRKHTKALISHGLCPQCRQKYYSVDGRDNHT